MLTFDSIEPFVIDNRYSVDVSWRYLEGTLQDYVHDFHLDMTPDFQRNHVWTQDQQTAYVEYILKGGPSGKDIYFNCPDFHLPTRPSTSMVLVDGLQRLTAVNRFKANEIPAFGHVFSDYQDRLPLLTASFRFHINTLKTRAEVIKWYLLFNAGGTPHTAEEIERVKALLAEEEAKTG